MPSNGRSLEEEEEEEEEEIRYVLLEAPAVYYRI
jgi:hypothetical protein